MPIAVESWLTMAAPIGTLLLRARDRRLTGIIIFPFSAGDVRHAEQADSPESVARVPVLLQARQELEEYFAGRRRTFAVPLDLTGLPPFTRHVLEVLRGVPCGETLSYGELAQRTGNPRAARAVGRAMAVNPLPIVIPCHRVVAAGGKPGGYSGGGGLQTKEWLLALERTGRLGN